MLSIEIKSQLFFLIVFLHRIGNHNQKIGNHIWRVETIVEQAISGKWPQGCRC